MIFFNKTMQGRFIIKYLILLTIFLTGCSSMSPIEKESESESHFKGAVYEGREFYRINEDVEGERYRIFHQASSSFSGTSGIRATAEGRASTFCNKEGKKMLTISEHTAKPPYILGNFPRIEIIFTCIDNGYSKLGSKSDSKYDELIKIKNY